MWNWNRLTSKVWPIILSVLAFLAVACGSAAPAEPTTAPQLTPTLVSGDAPTATPQDVATPPDVKVNPGKVSVLVGDLANERFDVLFTRSGPGGSNYGRIVHGFLISENEKKELLPGIASEWDLSADGLTWTFTIRKGVKWHDESEVTPEDVRWTLQRYWGPQAEEYRPSEESRAMDRIELSGPDKVSMITTIPFPTFDITLAEAGAHWYGIMPERANLVDEKAEVAYDNNPIGAGVMRLTNHVKGSVMSFERFDDFYYQPKNGFPEDRRVNFQSLDLHLVPEEATRVAAIRAGEGDIAPVSLAAKEQVKAGGGRMVFGREGVVVDARLITCFEPPRHPCYDKRVRQALNYAIDKELMRDTLYGPEVFELKGWWRVSPSTIGYTPGLDSWPFDPVKARELLADAGYPGGEGFGKFIMHTWPSTAMPFQVESAQLVADFWRTNLGLDVEVRVTDSTNINKLEEAGQLSGQIIWRENEARIDASSSVLSSYGDPGNRSAKHDDTELFRTVQEAVQILDADEREEALAEVYQRLRDENYDLPIGYANIPWAVGPRILTWQPYPLSQHISAIHTITLK